MSRRKWKNVEDRQEILDLLSLLCRLIDTRDFDRLGETYTADGSDDHGAGPVVGLEALRTWYLKSTENVAACIHNLSNVVIKVEGDTAVASSNAISWVWTMDKESGIEMRPVDYAIAVTYDDTLVRTPQGWRISSRVLKGNPSRTSAPHITVVGQLAASQGGIRALAERSLREF